MDIFAEVTNTIVAAIENDPGQLVMPWHRSGGGLPKNGTTDALYNGINVLALWASATINGYSSDSWASYKQWQDAGAQVQKGAKSSVIVFYKPLPVKEDEEKRFVLKYSRVFNASQVEGYEEPTSLLKTPLERLDAADVAIKATGITIKEQGDRAYYSPALDEVYIPDGWRFFDTDTSTREEAFYSTVFHELTHATAHKSRLDRQLGKRFGDPDYAFEELVAEIGAAFCCAKLNITSEPRLDHACYIKSWLQALNHDSKAVFKAAAFSQKACDYLLKPL